MEPPSLDDIEVGLEMDKKATVIADAPHCIEEKPVESPSPVMKGS